MIARKFQIIMLFVLLQSLLVAAPPALAGSAEAPPTAALASPAPQPAVGPTAPVGATAGSFEVSPSGAAIYSIPLVASPGTGGAQPVLSLQYNSQGGNGLLGLGWSLAGLSAIHRCEKTLELDGVKTAVNYDINDRLCLDGERLISAGVSEYRTRRETLQKVLALGGSSANPDHFRVLAQDGSLREYGATPDSRIEAPNAIPVRLWTLNKVQDHQGNYYAIRYAEDSASGDYRPLSIDYTGNLGAGLAPYNSIEFSYETRSDPLVQAEAGFTLTTTQRLAGVKAYADQTLVREYRLSYDNAGAAGQSRLTSMQECGTDGVCLPATSFSWQSASLGVQNWTWSNSQGPGNSGWRLADLFGDGRQLYYSHANAVMPNLSTLYWACTGIYQGGTGGGGGCTGWAPSGSPSQYGSSLLGYLKSVSEPGTHALYWACTPSSMAYPCGSANGGGTWSLRTSIPSGGSGSRLGYINSSNVAGSVALYWACTGIYQGGSGGAGSGSGGSGGGCTGWAPRTGSPSPYGGSLLGYIYSTNIYADVPGHGVHSATRLKADGTLQKWSWTGGHGRGDRWELADLFGDGRQVFWSHRGTTHYATRLNPDGTLQNWSWSGGSPAGSDGWDLVDLFGDGRQVYWAHSGTTHYATRLNADGTLQNWTWTSGSPVGNDGWQLADLFGDGRQVYWAHSGTTHYATRLNADGTLRNWTWTSGSPVGSSGWQLADLFGDGRQVYWAHSGTTHYATRLNPDGSLQKWSWTGGRAPGDAGWRLGDLFGAGWQIYYTHSKSGTHQATRFSAVRPDLLTGVTNGLGATIAITHTPLTDSAIYTKDSTTNVWGYPYLEAQPALYVVSSTAESNGLGGLNTTRYQYAGLKRHHTANATLGFRRVQTIDPAGLTSVTTYNQNREQGVDGTIAGSETYAGAVQVHSLTNSWSSAGGVCGGGSAPQLTASLEETRELDNTLVSQVTTSHSYDSCGFPTRVVVDYGDGHRTTGSTSYAHDTVGWLLGLPTRTETTSLAPGQSAQNRVSSYSYTNGLLTSEVVEPDQPALALTTSYTYDQFGNRWSTTVSGQGLASRGESLAYDPRGRAVVSRTNALGHGTSTDYDWRSGAPVRQTGPNGRTTSWVYDGLGRKTLELRPDGGSTSITLSGGTSGYTTLVQTSGTSPVSTSYDILGRETRSATIGFGGAWIYQERGYDALGRLRTLSKPSFANPPANASSYSYDILGRATAITTPGDQTTTLRYSGLTTTRINSIGQKRVELKDVQGRLLRVTEAADTSLETTTSYQYDPFGNLVEVRDPLGNVVATSYDSRGRKLATRDPDMGSWSYAYNVLGELVSQTDAKGQTTSMAYDLLGRLVSRASPEGTSSWSYDNAPNGIGQLASVTGPAGYAERYSYDSLGRPSEVVTTIGGQEYRVATSYDQYGLVASITYPGTGYSVRQVYDAYGHLSQLLGGRPSASPLLLWRADSANAQGQITQETFGNGVVSRRHYAVTTGDLAAIQTGSSPVTSNIQDLSYRFDAAGNLLERHDAIAALHERFIYDGLNRLTQASGAVTKLYAYDLIGNLISKSDVGSYAYTPSGAQSVRPHAVIATMGTSNQTYSYDANGNMISGAGRSIEYTSFNKPSRITLNGQSSSFTYDASYSRIQQETAAGSTVYIGKLYERMTSGSQVEHRHYLYAGQSLVAIYSQDAAGAGSTRYLHSQHLDSVDVVTDENGAVVERLSYDPHGRRRQVNGEEATTPIVSQINRGFTRHEHDDELGLINMNARLYDPLLGRFLTPDIITSDISRGQDLNRYSYVLNNPLSLSDPSGHSWLSKGLRRLSDSIKRFVKKWAKPIIAAVVAYYTAGAASEWFVSSFAAGTTGATYGTLMAGANIVGGAAGGFVSGAINGGDLKSGLYGAISGGLNNYLRAGTAFANPIDHLRGGASLGDVAKLLGTRAMSHVFSRVQAKLADRWGMSSETLNSALMGLSIWGNSLIGSRFKTFDAGFPDTAGIGFRGYLSREMSLRGFFFDTVDAMLGYQGLPTASGLDYLAGPYAGLPVGGHSLGTLDASYMIGNGFAPSGTLVALPFGNIAPANAAVSLGKWDLVNGGYLGKVFNWGAETVSTGVLGHSLCLYNRNC